MARLLSEHSAGDTPKRFFILAYVGGRITVLDTKEQKAYLVQTKDSQEAGQMMNFSDEQWEIWLEAATYRLTQADGRQE